VLQLKRLAALGWIEQRDHEGKPQIMITSEGLSAFKTLDR